ncbi:hypothetical protein DXG01_006615 [Tephrocybe rancida]|nr:hypothetical protein DXG01_006615 [Tephrocybe rancida]
MELHERGRWKCPSSFISLGVTWNFLPTSHTVNADWYSHVRGSTNDVAMKASFFDEENHFSNTLHIYIVGSINVSSDNVDGNKGYATYPQAYNGDPTLDGVVLANSAIPGGSDPNYNQGKALIHEMGHWFGLYHTFEGGCTEPNDQIPDTPQERYPGFCSEKDSCPDNAGSDPIHNFMDYGYDSCINEFTQGQINQMNDLRRLYRHGTPVQ